MVETVNHSKKVLQPATRGWLRVCVFGLLLSLPALAGAEEELVTGEMRRFDKGTDTCREFTIENVLAGAQTFRQLCKGCHARDNDQGAPYIHAESKTRRGWERVFSKRYPECAKSGAWDAMSRDDRLNLGDYLFKSAAGLYDPNCAA